MNVNKPNANQLSALNRNAKKRNGGGKVEGKRINCGVEEKSVAFDVTNQSKWS